MALPSRPPSGGRHPARRNGEFDLVSPNQSAGEITVILRRIEAGDTSAAAQILPLVYEELRKLAAAKMGRENSGRTLQATALVHEAWLRLGGDAQPRVRAVTSNTREMGGGASFSPDGRQFAAPSMQGFVEVIEATTWEQRKTLSGVLAGMHSSAYSPDAGRLDRQRFR